MLSKCWDKNISRQSAISVTNQKWSVLTKNVSRAGSIFQKKPFISEYRMYNATFRYERHDRALQCQTESLLRLSILWNELIWKEGPICVWIENCDLFWSRIHIDWAKSTCKFKKFITNTQFQNLRLAIHNIYKRNEGNILNQAKL